MSKFKRTVSDPNIFRENIIQKLNNLIKDNKISQNLEKGIFNYSLQEAEERNIIKK